MIFVWRTGTASSAVLQITPLAALGPRLAITLTFILGLVYLCLIIREFRRYGVAMDKAWRKRVLEWKETSQNNYEATLNRRSSPNQGRAFQNQKGSSPWLVGSVPGEGGPYPWGASPFIPPPLSYTKISVDPSQSVPFIPPPLVYTQTLVNSSQSLRPRPLGPSYRPEQDHSRVPFEAIKMMDLHVRHTSYVRPQLLDEHNIDDLAWTRFTLDASRVWDEQHLRFRQHFNRTPAPRPAPQDVIAQLIAVWNTEFFFPRGTQAVLCLKEKTMFDSHAIYLVDLRPSPDRHLAIIQGTQLAQHFGQMPAGLQCIYFYDPVPPFGDLEQPIFRPLHVLAGTSSRSSSKHLLLSNARSVGGHEKSSIDEDGHGERVASLSPQLDLRSDKLSPRKHATETPVAGKEQEKCTFDAT
ncbi:hypothetical protein H2248_011275 [Termitomyces sp. 'cryptogamus']|nr:hypothetical protein H2248_011275 [Termitomyces sp. 'cryptogamus']